MGSISKFLTNIYVLIIIIIIMLICCYCDPMYFSNWRINKVYSNSNSICFTLQLLPKSASDWLICPLGMRRSSWK